MKKMISGISALTLAAVMSMSASAASVATINPDPGNMPNPKPASAGFEVKYDVDPSYTVTIPAGVDITTGDKTADITLEQGALLLEGAKIKVVLESGQYTTTGSSFTAKTASGNSSASYQINGGDVKVGDVVASLDKDKLSAALTFSRTDTIKPTYAGTHSEVLTFGISVAVETTKSLKIEGYSFSVSAENRKPDSDLTISYIDGATWEQIVGMNDGLNVFDGFVCQTPINRLFNGTNQVKTTDVFDSNADYVFIWEN